MHDDFGVAVGLKNRAAMFELAAPLGGVGEIAVVAEGDFALVAIDHDGLRVEQRFVAGGGIARVADRRRCREVWSARSAEKFPRPRPCAMQVQFGAVARNNAGRFLAAMLQRVQAEIGQLGRFGVAENAARHRNGRESDRRRMRVCWSFRLRSARSNELAQISRSASTGESIGCVSLIFDAERRVPGNLADLAAQRRRIVAQLLERAASFVGETETMARAPRSPKSADSGGPASRALATACAEFALDAKQDSARVDGQAAVAKFVSRCNGASSCGQSDKAIDQALFSGEIDGRRFAGDDAGDGFWSIRRRKIRVQYRRDGVHARRLQHSDHPAARSRRLRSRKAIFRTREASSRIPSTPMTGVG